MLLQSLELACQHFMVCITADQHHIVKIPEQSHFVCIQCEPGVNTFLNDSSSFILSQMLVVEDYVILDE